MRLILPNLTKISLISSSDVLGCSPKIPITLLAYIRKKIIILSLQNNSFFTVQFLLLVNDGKEYSREYLHLQHFLTSFVLHVSDFCVFYVSFLVVKSRAFGVTCKKKSSNLDKQSIFDENDAYLESSDDDEELDLLLCLDLVILTFTSD